MLLDVGTALRVEDPQPEQLRHHLRDLPLEAPFLILSEQVDGASDVDVDRFIQTRPYSGGYRVEWRDGTHYRHALVSLAGAEDLLCAYLRRDDAALRGGAEWHALRWYNDPYYGLIAAGLICAAILTVLLAAEVWHMIR
jgi:hypothetical protein